MIPLVDLKAQHDSIKEELDETLRRVIDNSSFILGNEVLDFERNFAEWCGRDFCIGVNNGTSSLTVALKCLGVKDGDEIIMPVNTFIATAFAVTLLKAKPVFVDINEDDFLINTEKIEEKITEKTKVIIPVHLYGNVCDMDKISEIADKHKLKIVEDCAQAHGSTYKGKKVPITGIGSFSFFPAKILGSLGDAGAVVLDNKELSDKCRKYVNHGRKEKYYHDEEGYNFRISALQAAVLNTKLKYLDSWIMKRSEIVSKYNKEFEGMLKQENSENVKSGNYMYTIRNEKRDEMQKFLKNKGIASQIYYPVPLHLQPALFYLGYKNGDFPVAEKIASEILSIPLYPELKPEDQNKIIESVKEFVS